MGFARSFRRRNQQIGGRPWSATRERLHAEHRARIERFALERAQSIAALRIAEQDRVARTWRGRCRALFARIRKLWRRE